MKKEFLFGSLFAVLCVFHVSSATTETDKDSTQDFQSPGKQLVEQGRTLVHHAVKRLMIILPAIFFKLGIAFTLLIIVALAAVNNGFIGFLLLVVGLSSVLARLQESRRPALSVPYISPLPPYHHQVWDRSDSTGNKAVYYNGYGTQNLQYSPGLSNYYSRYSNSKV